MYYFRSLIGLICFQLHYYIAVAILLQISYFKNKGVQMTNICEFHVVFNLLKKLVTL